MYWFFHDAQELCEAAKSLYRETMLGKTRFAAIMALLFVGWNVNAQTAAVDDPENEESGDFSEVFVLQYSGSRATHNFELPENRTEWLLVEEKIRSNKVDDEVYYVMLRGEKPDDIFTPELMAIYKTNSEEWLLKKWGPELEQSEQGQPALRSPIPTKQSFFIVFDKDGKEAYRSMPGDRLVRCDSSGFAAKRVKAIRQSKTLSMTEQLNLMYSIMLNETECQKAD